jgi:hypothetical protein
MTSYNLEHREAFHLAVRYLNSLPEKERYELQKQTAPYLRFREIVAGFQEAHLSGICTSRCFNDRRSECCAREGIQAFFADVIINVMISSEKEIQEIDGILLRDSGGDRCVYLTESGCLWRLKPIVCEMFLCEDAKEKGFGKDDRLRQKWEDLRKQEKAFTWPDRPVLFDDLESRVIHAGMKGPLMYYHNSPGLLRVKSKAGL